MTVKHHANCPDPTRPFETFVGRLGDTLEGCPACHAFKVAKGTPPAEPAASRTRYRCRDHGKAVNWRGTGCSKCDEARDTYRANRAARRRARLAQR